MASKKSPPEKTAALHPEDMNPQTPEDFIQRAWLYYSRRKYDVAEKDFVAALESQPENIDACFGLALVLKTAGATSKALEYFEKALQLLEPMGDKQRAQILTRLIHGQINQIKTGDWNLEKEVWQSVH